MMLIFTISAMLLLSPPSSGAGAKKESMGETAALRAEARIGRARFSLMRADGVELAWAEGTVSLPEFTGRSALPDALRFEAPWLDPETGTTMGVGQTVRFEVDRNTFLRDGGISGDAQMLSGDAGLMRLTSLAAGEGEYDIYDLSLAWDAYTPGPLTVSVIGGIKAIDARISRTVSEGGGSSMRTAYGVAAVPVVGGGILWRLTEDMTLSGTATTQGFDGQGSVLDLSAETSIRLAPNIGLSAGYQFLRSTIEVQSLDTELEREGVFARIQIRF